MEHAPGAMFMLGVQKKGHEGYSLHHPKFDLDERALPIGTAMLVETALKLLKHNVKPDRSRSIPINKGAV